ncbi:ARS-binding protein 2 [Rhypophila decipiens]
MQRISEQSVFTASPTSIHPEPSPGPGPGLGLARGLSPRPPLPDSKVDSSSIVDAYVSFILHCNPAVPPDTDPAALREAFLAPPKSGGKTFSTFTLFELIKQLETKELKTWAELALKLGVEPPDQEKGQSSQKIQQYAVRLKRWMHSMHVDAFFEYLMGRAHPYWTEIPADDTPITEMGRDGVAAEDDMALRALLPHIKPRRGRRKPDDDETNNLKSPSQRPSPQPEDTAEKNANGHAQSNQDLQEPWTAQPAERGSVFLFPPPGQARLHPPAPSWGHNLNDSLQTPLTAYPHMQPHSAITPSTRNAFWADEPKSAITPSKSRSRRHGAKVVSSAWRIGGSSASGKTRGRPPNSRMGNIEGPFSAFPATGHGSDVLAFKLPSPTPDRSAGPAVPQSAITPTTGSIVSSGVPLPHEPTEGRAVDDRPGQDHTHQHSHQESVPRPAKRSRLSLQVPERVGGQVRLATPPLPPPPLSAPAMATPVVTITGAPANGTKQSEAPAMATPAVTITGVPANGTKPNEQPGLILDPTDHTNKHEMESFFVSQILGGNWFSHDHKELPPCSIGEAWALAEAVIDKLLRTAATPQAFLINLAALAGGRLLMAPNTLNITRQRPDQDEDGPRKQRYLCEWHLQFGSIRGSYSMEETVLVDKWRTAGTGDLNTTQPRPTATRATTGAATRCDNDNDNVWEGRFIEATKLLQQRDEELERLRSLIVGALKESRQPGSVIS